MEAIYSTGEVCDRPDDETPGACYVLDPDLYGVMAQSRDYNELVWAWKGWRDTCGPAMKSMYTRYVELGNEAAKLNDQPDMGAYWRSWYEMDNFEEEMMRLWDEVQPLYLQLHAFVRRKLSELYGEKYVSLYGGIPAHLLGNMWAQDWMSISDLVLPYPDKPSVDVTDELVKQGYDAMQMFELSEEFFVSLGLIPSPESFWTDSMIERPDDGRQVVCHASAWDFYNRKDFRIKQCTSITHDDLITVHHEMGHTQYFFQYAPHPVEYRDGANPGFHEAVGDVISLSVQTPEHLNKVGLLPDYEEDEETDLNFLMTMALQKIAFLPFGLLVDMWRWEVFAGNVTEHNYNERWWQMRTSIQGLVSPVKRSDLVMDFDPGSKFHVPADVPYIRYFISHILQFQFHESVCIAAGQFDPDDANSKLHQCDIYQSHEAGKLLGDMLKMGSSVPWPDAMEAITGQRDMSAKPLIEFFQPLIDWLEEQNEMNGDVTGWDLNWSPPEDEWTEPELVAGGISHVRALWLLPVSLLFNLYCNQMCAFKMQDGLEKMAFREMSVLGILVLLVVAAQAQDKITNETLAEAYLDEYNAMAQEVYFKSVTASWNYNTNLTDYNQAQSVAENLIESAFSLQARLNVSQFDWTNFTHDIQRQIGKIYYVGSSALTGEDLKNYEQILADMEKIYSTAKVCRDGECHPLDPDLTATMAKSRDYEELKWAWESWRKETGPKMKDMYEEFVTLANKAAEVNDQPDMGAYWRSWYEMDNLESETQRLWEQLRPFYEQLHAYVRGKLIEVYGSKYVDPNGPIPAHLLGNMWAQSWGNVLDLVLPYPDKTSIDITPELVKQGYDATKMFELSEEFFTSLGLPASPKSFWNDSMFVRPDDGREVVCHASAWDFYNAKDIRIKMCTVVNMEDLITIHHEMGHTQYYLQYKHLPVVYRRGANPGFHEAVGDLLALSVSTPEHLKEIGLLPELVDDDETDINFLMSMALDKIAFLPFGILMDMWRWDVFAGNTPKNKYTEAWWKLRTEIQGVVPPVPRSDDEGHFDPGAKFHIPGNTPYIRYFVSHVLQFQFHRALCEEAGNTRALHRCDIYKSTAAGTKLGNMLKLGSSKEWPDALEQIAGTREMDASAIVAYFQPLMKWLEEKNKEAGYEAGWDNSWTPPDEPWTSGVKSTLMAPFTIMLLIVCATFLVRG
ncbi:angiotensin-converting enzyme-like [Glandiceps talaboti]